MSTAPLIFLDTETCGLGLDDPIWEVALIRREVDGTETEHRFYIEHDVEAADKLPEQFRADHAKRYDASEAKSVPVAMVLLEYLLRPAEDGTRAHIVGAVPNFDTERIAHQFRISPWHYHLVDVEALAAGALGVEPPWDSDDLSSRVGVRDWSDRHTALGDARWAKAIYDAVITTMSTQRDKP